jgi:tripartite-type tricarboxylate transporter receptor subunit TctC
VNLRSGGNRAAVLLAALLVSVSAVAQSESYPNRPVRFIIPYAAGGATDSIGRLVGQKMAQELGESIVVENRAGADGNIGATVVAKAAPDGYTILLGDVGNMTMGPAVRRNVPFDPVRDFAPISQLVSAPNIVVVNPSVPVNTFSEFIAYAKANPGKLSYASSGTGGSAHLAGELLKRATGIDMIHVPYKGASAAIPDVLRGEVQVMIGLSPVLPLVRDQRLRPLATTGLKRTTFLPEIPAIAEVGFPGFEATAWYGLFAPAGTPKAVLSRLHDVAIKALKSPDVKSKLEAAGNEVIGSNPEDFAAYIRSELKKWADVVAAAGIKVE